MNLRKCAALGIGEQILPLKSLGFTIHECRSLKEAQDIINRLSGEEYELVIVTENIIENRIEEFLKMLRKLSVTVVVLPEFGVKRNLTKETMKRIIREAVGLKRV